MQAIQAKSNNASHTSRHKRKQRQKGKETERRKKEEEEENKKNLPPPFLPEPLSTKNHPPKKLCGPYIKFV